MLTATATAAHADSVDLDLMTETARHLATRAQCDDVRELGDHVRALDADYYAREFALVPSIAGCLDPELKPPSSVAPWIEVPRTGEPKSVGAALGLSLGTTAAGVALLASRETALFGAGFMLVGPSLGRAYIGGSYLLNPWLVARVVGLSAAVVAISQMCIFCDETRKQDELAGVALGGVVVFVAGSMLEIAATPIVVHEYNRAHGWEPAITVAPIATPGGAGLGVLGRF